MKKIIFKISIFFLLIFNLTLLILPSSARYISLDFGYAWNVLFSKYSVFADDFIIHLPTYVEDDDIYKSKELWGVPGDEIPNKVQNWGDGYKITDLNDVAFTVRNNTDFDITLGNFIIELYLFKNASVDIIYRVKNSASTNEYQYIEGGVSFLKENKKIEHVGFTPFIIENNNTEHDYAMATIYINPLEYYKNVTLKDDTLKYHLDSYKKVSANPSYVDNAITAQEKATLEEYYVLNPGEVFEFNISILNTEIGNGSTNHSAYAKVSMTAEKYDSDSVVVN